MKKQDDIGGYWTGWIVAYGLAAGLFIFVAWRGSYAQGLCAPAEIHCFRDWMSASGGWAALAAAIPTVLFLSRQVRDANRHHRHNMALALRRTRGKARFAKKLAESVRTYALSHQLRWEKRIATEEWTDNRFEITMPVEWISKAFRDVRLHGFLEEIDDDADLLSESVGDFFNLMADVLMQFADEGKSHKSISEAVAGFFKASVQRSENLIVIIDRYLAETDEILSEGGT
jgi:hypothetical protein